MAKCIGNDELNSLLGTQGRDYRTELKEWASLIDFFVSGRDKYNSVETPWHSKSEDEKIQLVREFNDVILGVLSRLSTGMPERPRMIRVT